jgi:hypothetical protein
VQINGSILETGSYILASMATFFYWLSALPLGLAVVYWHGLIIVIVTLVGVFIHFIPTLQL